MLFKRFNLWKWLDSKFGIPKEETPKYLPWNFDYTDEVHEYDWDDWHRDMKIKYPIRHWIFHEFSIWASVKYKIWIEDPIYKFKSLYIKKQHILDLRKGNFVFDPYAYKYGYTDPCNVVELALYASFINYLEELEANYGPQSIHGEPGLSALDKCIKNTQEWVEENSETIAPNEWLDHYKKIKEIKFFFEEELPKLNNQSDNMYPPKGITRAQAKIYYDKKDSFDKSKKEKINYYLNLIIVQREFMWT